MCVYHDIIRLSAFTTCACLHAPSLHAQSPREDNHLLAGRLVRFWFFWKELWSVSADQVPDTRSGVPRVEEFGTRFRPEVRPCMYRARSVVRVRVRVGI
jgi:hypothetical protein